VWHIGYFLHVIPAPAIWRPPTGPFTSIHSWPKEKSHLPTVDTSLIAKVEREMEGLEAWRRVTSCDVMWHHVTSCDVTGRNVADSRAYYTSKSSSFAWIQTFLFSFFRFLFLFPMSFCEWLDAGPCMMILFVLNGCVHVDKYMQTRACHLFHSMSTSKIRKNMQFTASMICCRTEN
jgi:hypothetical protein